MGEDNDYNELFGLEPEGEGTDPGGDGGEPVEPEAGGGEAETAPAAEGGGEAGEAAAPKPGRPEAGDTPPARGRAPLAAGAEAGGREAAPLDTDELIRGLGITDPYTGKPVTTRGEYDAYRQRAYDERREAIKRRSGLTDAELDDFVSSTPAVQKAMADAAAARSMMERQRREDARRRVDSEVAKIAALDPGVRSVADLTRSENYETLLELTRRGYELSDAWKIANFERLRGQAQTASRQAAYNAQSGKAGMVATKSSGQGGDTVPVPKDTLELYRAINPEMSDAEIRADYNRYRKSVKN